MIALGGGSIMAMNTKSNYFSYVFFNLLKAGKVTDRKFILSLLRSSIQGVENRSEIKQK